MHHPLWSDKMSTECQLSCGRSQKTNSRSWFGIVQYSWRHIVCLVCDYRFVNHVLSEYLSGNIVTEWAWGQERNKDGGTLVEGQRKRNFQYHASVNRSLTGAITWKDSSLLVKKWPTCYRLQFYGGKIFREHSRDEITPKYLTQQCSKWRINLRRKVGKMQTSQD